MGPILNGNFEWKINFWKFRGRREKLERDVHTVQSFVFQARVICVITWYSLRKEKRKRVPTNINESISYSTLVISPWNCQKSISQPSLHQKSTSLVPVAYHITYSIPVPPWQYTTSDLFGSRFREQYFNYLQTLSRLKLLRWSFVEALKCQYGIIRVGHGKMTGGRSKLKKQLGELVSFFSSNQGPGG